MLKMTALMGIFCMPGTINNGHCDNNDTIEYTNVNYLLLMCQGCV